MTRAEAQAAGVKYYTGPVCRRGHSQATRYTSCGSCVECVKIQAEVWHKDNPEKVRDACASYRARNPSKVSQWHTNWVKANPVRAREIDAAYRERNRDTVRAMQLLSESLYRSRFPERIRAKAHARRAAKLGSKESHTAADIVALEKKQNGRCAHAWCRVKFGKRYHVDHIIPLVAGGSNGRKNIQLLCPRCNLQKGRRHPVDFAQSMGMLV